MSFLLPALPAIAGAGAAALFSGGGPDIEGSIERTSQAESQAIQDLIRRRQMIEDLILGASENRPPSFSFDVDDQGMTSVPEGFFDDVRPMADINLLLRLAQQGAPFPGAAQAGVGLAANASRRQQQLGSEFGVLLDELLFGDSGILAGDSGGGNEDSGGTFLGFDL